MTPPDQTGSIDKSKGKVINELKANFGEWGGYCEMSNDLEYSGCIELIQGHCTKVCKKNDVQDQAICNPSNINRIGFYGSGGSYPLRLNAKYKNTTFALHSELVKEATFENIDNAPVQLSLLQNIPNVTDSEMLNKLNSKTIIPIAILCDKLIKLKSIRRELPSDVCQCDNNGECTSNQICKCKNQYFGRHCELSSEMYYTIKNYSEVVIFSIVNMIQRGEQISMDVLLEAFSIVSIIPSVAISNGVCTSMLSSIVYSIENHTALDEYNIEHLYFITRNLINAMKEDIIYDTLLKSNSNHKDYMKQVSLIEAIYKQLLAMKVGHKYFIGQQENISLGPVNLKYLINTVSKELSSNLTYSLSQSTEYSFALEYPLELSKSFTTPSGYLVGSSALGIALYNDLGTHTNMTVAFATDVLNSQLKSNKAAEALKKNWDLACGCYNNEEGKFNKTVCTKVVLSSDNEQFICTCIGSYSPCYMVFRFPQWKIIAITLHLAVALAMFMLGFGIWKMRSQRRELTKTVVNLAGGATLK